MNKLIYKVLSVFPLYCCFGFDGVCEISLGIRPPAPSGFYSVDLVGANTNDLGGVELGMLEKNGFFHNTDTFTAYKPTGVYDFNFTVKSVASSGDLFVRMYLTDCHITNVDIKSDDFVIGNNPGVTTVTIGGGTLKSLVITLYDK